jgi:hypothetical protein
MSSPFVQPASFDVSKVSVSAPKLLDSGSKQAYLNYGESRNLVFQTPSLPSPFGLNVFDKAGPPKYSVDLAMRGYQENPKVKSFFNALSALDATMIDLGVKNSRQWFGKEMKREIIEAFYSPSVKFGRDKEGNPSSYPPNINVKLKKRGDDFECKFFDQKSREDPRAPPLTGIPLEELLVKRCEVTALIQCTGVWFAGGKFGLSWKGIQMRLDKVPESIRGYAFQDDDEDGEFSSKPAASRPAASRAAPAAVAEPEEFGGGGGAADEEDEEETPAPAAARGAPAVEEDEDDEEVAPIPVPKKPVVATKKTIVKKAAK